MRKDGFVFAITMSVIFITMTILIAIFEHDCYLGNKCSMRNDVIFNSDCLEGSDCYYIDKLHWQYPEKSYEELEGILFNKQ